MTDPEFDDLFSIPDPAGKSRFHPPPLAKANPVASSPSREDRQRKIILVLAGILLYQATWLVVVEHRADLEVLTAREIALGLGVPLVAMALALFSGLRSGRSGLGLRSRLVALAIVGAPFIFAFLGVATAPKMTDPLAPFWDRAIRCVAVCAALTVPSLSLLMWSLRRSFVTNAGPRTAALGVACGALAAGTMSLACAHSEALHVVVAHGAMIVVGGAIGGLFAHSVTRA